MAVALRRPMRSSLVTTRFRRCGIRSEGGELQSMEWSRVQPFITFGFLIGSKLHGEVTNKLDEIDHQSKC